MVSGKAQGRLADGRGRMPPSDPSSESAVVLVDRHPRGGPEPGAQGATARAGMAHGNDGARIGGEPNQLARGIQQRHPHAGHEQPSEIRAIAAETIERGHPDDEGMRDGRFAWMWTEHYCGFFCCFRQATGNRAKELLFAERFFPLERCSGLGLCHAIGQALNGLPAEQFAIRGRSSIDFDNWPALIP